MSKILLVEDESALISVYTELLESEGYTVLAATDGDIGLDKALNQEWDLMILDIMLPKMDGLSILRKLRDSNRINKRPIIVLSNLDSSNVVEEAIKLGATKHFSKADISPDKILSLISGYLTTGIKE